MSENDIIERLKHCSDNCGDEYLHELSGRAADEITRLRGEVNAHNHAEVKYLVEIDELRAEVERLKANIESWKKIPGQIAAIYEDQSEITALRAEVERLRAALVSIKELPGEINHGNYNHDDVVALNNAFCEAFHIATAALGDTK